MKLSFLDSPRTVAFLLLSAGAIFIGIAMLTDREEITSFAVVIVGAICFFTGIFVMTYSTGENFDPHLVSLLPIQGYINLCRITADLGILGSARFLPPPFHNQEGVQQYIPVSRYDNLPVMGDSSIILTGCGGVLVVPSCAPIMENLRINHGLEVPSDSPGLDSLFVELGEEVLECARSVRVERKDNIVIVILSDYVFIEGCKTMSAESSRCCIVSPCPICSLFGALLAESEQKPVAVLRCEPKIDSNTVTAVFFILQDNEEDPLSKDDEYGTPA